MVAGASTPSSGSTGSALLQVSDAKLHLRQYSGDHNDWQSWRFNLRSVLRAKKLVKFLDGPDLPSEDEHDAIYTLISNSVNGNAVRALLHFREGDGVAAYRKLAEGPEPKRGTGEFQLIRALVNDRVEEPEGAEDHIGQKQEIETQLETMGTSLKDILHYAMVDTLPEEFARIQDVVATLNAPTTGGIENLIMDKQDRVPQKATSGEALKTQARPNRPHRDNGGSSSLGPDKEKCGHCPKPGHSEEDCWTKHPEKRPPPRRRGNQNQEAGAKIATTTTPHGKLARVLATDA